MTKHFHNALQHIPELSKHLRKHHRKYLVGAAGLVGLVKLFSVLLLGLSGYIATHAATPDNGLVDQTLQVESFAQGNQSRGNGATVMIPAMADIAAVESQLRSKGRFSLGKDGRTLEGSAPLDLSASQGKLLAPIVHTSDTSKDPKEIRVRYPEGVVAKTDGNDFSGTLITPKYLTQGDLGYNSSGVVTVELGESGKPITFEDESGNPTNVEIEVELPQSYQDYSGYLSISYSEDNINYQYFGTGEIKILSNGKKGVVFLTNHFTTFSVYGSIGQIFEGITFFPWSGQCVTNHVYFQYDLQPRADPTSIYINSHTIMVDNTYGKSMPTGPYGQYRFTGYIDFGAVNYIHYRSIYLDVTSSYEGRTGASFGKDVFYIDVHAPGPFNFNFATGYTFNSSTPTLSWTLSDDTYTYDCPTNVVTYRGSIFSGQLCLNVLQGITTTTPSIIPSSLPDGNYSILLQAYDSAGNVSSGTNCRSFNISTDIIAPTVNPAYISAGTTVGSYFKGTITASATGSDDIGIIYGFFNSGFSTWSPSFGVGGTPGNSTFDYVLTPGQNITIAFAAQDAAGNRGTGTSKSYTYDATPPTSTLSLDSISCTGINFPVQQYCDDAAGVGCLLYAFKAIDIGSSCNSDSMINGVSSHYLDITGAAGAYTQKKICHYAGDYLGNSGIIQTSPSPYYNIDKVGPTSTPTLSSPSTGATVNILMPTLSRGAVVSDVGCSTVARYTGGIYSNAGCSTPTQNISTTATNYTASSSLSNTTYYRKIAAVDALGNIGTYSACQPFTVDTVVPSITQKTAIASYINTTSAIYTFTGNKVGTITFGSNCPATRNTTGAVVDDNPITFSSLSATTYAGCTITVTDAVGSSTPLTIPTFTVDLTAPTISSFISNASTYNSGLTITATGIFSEAVIGVDASNIYCSNCTALTPTKVSATQYRWTISAGPTQGSVYFFIQGGGIQDSGGNLLVDTSVQLSITYDTIKPFCSSISYSPDSSLGRTNGNITATCTPSETSTYLYPAGSSTYTFTTNGSTGFVLMDAAGNTGGSLATGNRIDKTAPTLTAGTSLPSITNLISLTYTFGSNESGVVHYAGTCPNGSLTNALNSASNSTIYTMTNGSTYTTCQLYITDAAGNNSNSITVTTSTTVDATPPTIGTITKSPDNGTTYFTGSIVLNAPMSDTYGTIQSCKYSINGGTSRAAGTYNAGTCTSPTITPGASITARFAATDTAGNITTGASTTVYAYDGTPPTVTLNSGSLGAYFGGSSLIITGNFSEAPVGFDASDVTCTSCTVSHTKIDATTYKLTLFAISVGLVTVQIGMETFTDAAGNANASASRQISFTYDNEPPTANSITINSGASYTSGATVSLVLSAFDDTAGLSGMQFSCDATTWSARESYAATKSSFNITTSAGCTTNPGLKTVYVRYQDRAMNTGLSTNASIIYDTTAPNVLTGLISAGTTGINGSTLYFNGAISLQAVVGDLYGIDTSSCFYTTGNSRVAADGYTATAGISGYCYVNSLAPTNTVNIRFRVKDNAGNLMTGATGTYVYDNAGPIAPVTTSPISGYPTNTGTIILTWASSSDAGIGISGYYYEVSQNDNTFGNIVKSGTTGSIGSTAGVKVTLLPEATYYRRVYAIDKFNIQGPVSNLPYFIVNMSASTVDPGYIYSGTAGINGLTGFYKGIVDISGSVSDNAGLSTGTCLYTTGNGRQSAAYVGNASGGYCYKTGLNFTSTLNLRFSIQNKAGTVTTGATGTYLYDNVGPYAPVLVSPVSTTSDTGTVDFQRNAASDTGIGTIGYIYQISISPTFASFVKSGIVISGASTLFLTSTGLASATYYRRAYAFDQFHNTGAASTAGTFNVNSASTTVNLGYVYSGKAGLGADGSNYYYKGPIEISGSVSNGVGLNTGTCLYTINGGANRPTASYSGSNTAGYCYKIGINSTLQLDIAFSIESSAGVLKEGTARTYFYDNTGPDPVTNISPSEGASINTGTVTLIVDPGAGDAGIGTSGYVYQISTGVTFTRIFKLGTGFITGMQFTGLANNTYYRRAYAYDIFLNTSSVSTYSTLIVDLIPPSVATGYISSGYLGAQTPLFYLNGSTGYYKGPIEIYASVSDTIGLDTTSCKYTTGATRRTATYQSFTTNIDGICVATGLNLSGTLKIRFAITDLAGNIFTGATGIYLHDLTGPDKPTLIKPLSTVNTLTFDLLRNTAADNGLGISGYYYQVYTGTSPKTMIRTGYLDTTGTTISLIVETGYSRQVYAIDMFNNTGTWSDTGNFIVNTAVPQVDTYVVYSGIAGINGATGYYKGPISISGGVSDGSSLNTSSCKFTTGRSWIPASYQGTTKSGYCYVTGLNYTTGLAISFSITNGVSLTTTGDIALYLYDANPPSVPTLVSPSDLAILGTSSTGLRRAPSTDTGIGISGYFYELSSGSTVISSGRIIDPSVSQNIAGLQDITYTRRVYSYDRFMNSGAWSTIHSFSVNAAETTVDTGFVYSGNTAIGSDGQYYYRGILNISGSVYNSHGVSGSTCLYTTGNDIRAKAGYSGTSNAGYCYKTGLNYTTTLDIAFSIQSSAGNLSVGGVRTYLYDTTGPDVPSLNAPYSGQFFSGSSVDLGWSAATDLGGVGVSGYLYQISTGANFSLISLSGTTSSTTTTLTSLTDRVYFWRIAAFDRLQNTGSRSETGIFIIDMTKPTGTISINTGAVSATNSMTILSLSGLDTNGVVSMQFSCNSTIWSPLEPYSTSKSRDITNGSGCMGGDGTKTGYVRFLDTAGNLSLSTGIYDTIDFTTAIPFVDIGSISSGITATNPSTSLSYYRGTINITGAVSSSQILSGSTCLYTTGNDIRAKASYAGTPTAGYCYKTGLNNFTSDLAIRFSIQNVPGNIRTGDPGIYYYDNLGPSRPELLSNSTGLLVGTGTLSLERSPSIDDNDGDTIEEAGLSGYLYQISTGANFTLLYTSGTSSSEAITIAGLSDRRYYRKVYAFDRLLNKSTRSETGSFIVDTTKPTGALSINGGATYVSDPLTTLTLTGADTNGMASMQFSCNGTTWSPLEPYTTPFYRDIINGSGCSSPEGSKTVYVHLIDNAGNRTGASDTIILDTQLPVIGIGYISSGITATNPMSSTNYYRGTITISGAVSDNLQLATGTCMYTTDGYNRYQASYKGTSSAGYCYKTGLNTLTDTLYLRFSIQDVAGNTFTGDESIYYYDITQPTQVTLQSPTDGQYLTTGIVNLLRSESTDDGAGISGYFYQILSGSQIVRTGTVAVTGITIIGLRDTSYSRNVYPLDRLTNSGVWTTPSSFIVDTTKPTCTMTYTPASYTNQDVFALCTPSESITFSGGTGLYIFTNTGSYIFSFTDVAGNTGSTTATVTWISKVGPLVTTGYAIGDTIVEGTGRYYFSGSLDIQADVSSAIGLSGSTCQYTTGKSRASASYLGTSLSGYCYVAGMTTRSANTPTSIKFRIQDVAGNLIAGATGTIIRDTLPPTTRIDELYTQWTGNNLTIPLSISDGINGVGVETTYYCTYLGSTPCNPTTVYPSTGIPITCALGSVCKTYVTYYSIDKLGNTESTGGDLNTSLIMIDKQTPPAFRLVSLSGTTLCPDAWNSFVRNRTGNISSYAYEFYTSPNMLPSELQLSLSIYGDTGTSMRFLTGGTYYTRMVAFNPIGKTGTSNQVILAFDKQYCANNRTGIFIASQAITNASINTVYTSNTLTVLGLTGTSVVNISTGTLLINNISTAGTSGTIQIGGYISIGLLASPTFGTTLTSLITINGYTGAYSLTTISSGCTLSSGDQALIYAIYTGTIQRYDGNDNPVTEDDFRYRFASLDKNSVALKDDCTKAYRDSLFDNLFNVLDTRDHKTPNCKTYKIVYDYVNKAFYSPSTVKKFLFANRESLRRYLDFYNPGDCNINTYTTNYLPTDILDPMRHVAPNGKIYHIVGKAGGYSATEFAKIKSFTSLTSINDYIDKANPFLMIRNHIIDRTFTPLSYTAPNGLVYKIYKTDRGYMSYKFKNVKYLETLALIKTFITNNNPKK